jgi:hypothetical protein
MADPFNQPNPQEQATFNNPGGTVYQAPPAPQPGETRPAASPGVRTGVSPMVKGGASWFYWIGALSVINAVLGLSGASIQFIFGLGITEIFTAIGHQGGTTGGAAALVATLVVAGVFAIFGYFAGQGQKWAFIVGMLLYLGDGLLLLPAGLILSAAFHLWALFRMFMGYRAIAD